jgi:hypothetical protein
MEREDARTVSVTTVTAFATRLTMTYRPLELDADAEGTSIRPWLVPPLVSLSRAT